MRYIYYIDTDAFLVDYYYMAQAIRTQIVLDPTKGKHRYLSKMMEREEPRSKRKASIIKRNVSQNSAGATAFLRSNNLTSRRAGMIVVATASVTPCPAVAGSVGTCTAPATAFELGQADQSKGNTTLLRLHSRSGVDHDIHGVDPHTRGHFPIVRRSGERSRPSQELLDDTVRERRSGSGRFVARKSNVGPRVDTRSTPVGAACPVLRGMFGPTMLHTSGACTLEPTGAARAGQGRNCTHRRHDIKRGDRRRGGECVIVKDGGQIRSR
jgi:hypothetical protein